MTDWAVLTGEYPPQPGGVSDYARLVARGLAAAGDRVRVYAPATATAEESDPGVEVRRLPGRFGPRALARLDRLLAARPRPDHILVQYVPQAYGMKGMNVGFAAWLAARALRAAPVWVMFHEVATPFAWQPLRHAALAGITRAMARLAAGAAERVFVSIPAWGDALRRLCPRVRPPRWLPVPSTLEEYAGVAPAARGRFAPAGRPLVGHFGTYGLHVATMLTATLAELATLAPDAAVLLVGRGSAEFAGRLVSARPELAGRVAASGGLSGADAAAHLKACDLLIQPFPDGVSSRRTSAMAGLACGLPVVTNLGPLSEPVWAGAVAAAPTPDPAAVARLGRAGRPATPRPAARPPRGRGSAPRPPPRPTPAR